MRYFIIPVLLFCVNALSAQCVSEVKSFKPGEKITYQAYYNWGFVWIHAGDVEFSVKERTYRGEQVFQFDAIGNSLKSYDWLYKVRDHFQSFVNMQTFSPMFAERKTSEGGYDAYENYTFASSESKIYTVVATSKKPFKRDTLTTKPCIFDVLTTIYYCRTINFEQYKPDEKIAFNFVLDNEIYRSYIRYLGKETIKTHDNKKYKCIKFTALLVEGTIFKGGEDMTIWVTDDGNRIPVLVEAKILIGSVKAYINTTEGLKNENQALVN
jgi:hypothetical protein